MRLLLILLVSSLVALAAGCWGQPDSEGHTYNVLPYPDVVCEPDTVAPHTDSGDPELDVTTGQDTPTTGGDGPCDCMAVGSWYRFDVLRLDKLDGDVHPVIATLNPLWLADIVKTELNVLFEVTDVAADNITFRAINAARVGTEGAMCVLESTAVTFDFPREGCTLTGSTSSAINVYSGDEAHPKNCTTVLPVHHAIPVQQVVLEAELAEDCGRIDEGVVLSGVIGKAELLDTCTCLVLGNGLSDQCGDLEPDFVSDQGFCKGCNDTYINLEELLVGFGDLEYKCTTLTDGPGVCIEGHFSAYRLDETPPVCDE